MNTWRGSEEAQPTAAGLVSGYGSRALGGLESPGMSIPAPQRLLSSQGDSLSPLVLIQQGKERITVCCTQREQHRGRQEGFPLLRSWDRMGVALHPASRPQHHSPTQGQIHSSAALGEQSTSSPGEELGLAEIGQEDVSQALQPPPQPPPPPWSCHFIRLYLHPAQHPGCKYSNTSASGRQPF